MTLDGSPYDGTGYFKFAVVDAGGATTYWSNDGSSDGGGEPEYGVPLTVDNGLFNVLLGDTSLENMPEELVAEVFEDTECYLRVWFSSDGGTFVQLSPDRRIAAAPYALQAQEALQASNTDTVDGLHASELETHYQNVVIVAKSGGDYTSVQAAIDSITGETADNAYLVWVAPGVYEEQVTMKPFVHLQGAGQEVIASTASSVDWPPTQATLVLASDASLRDLTLGNSGAGEFNVALLATARAQGGGTYNYAIYLTSNDTNVTLQQVTALGENGSDENFGLYNQDLGAATLRGGSFTGRGGIHAYGIFNTGFGATLLEAEGVIALGEDGSDDNYGLYNSNGATARLHGGSFTGRGGGQ